MKDMIPRIIKYEVPVSHETQTTDHHLSDREVIAIARGQSIEQDRTDHATRCYFCSELVRAIKTGQISHGLCSGRYIPGWGGYLAKSHIANCSACQQSKEIERRLHQIRSNQAG